MSQALLAYSFLRDSRALLPAGQPSDPHMMAVSIPYSPTSPGRSSISTMSNDSLPRLPSILKVGDAGMSSTSMSPADRDPEAIPGAGELESCSLRSAFEPTDYA